MTDYFDLRTRAESVVLNTDWQAEFYEEQPAVPRVELQALSIAIDVNAGRPVSQETINEMREAIADVPGDWEMDMSDASKALDALENILQATS